MIALSRLEARPAKSPATLINRLSPLPATYACDQIIGSRAKLSFVVYSSVITIKNATSNVRFESHGMKRYRRCHSDVRSVVLCMYGILLVIMNTFIRFFRVMLLHTPLRRPLYGFSEKVHHRHNLLSPT